MAAPIDDNLRQYGEELQLVDPPGGLSARPDLRVKPRVDLAIMVIGDAPDTSSYRRSMLKPDGKVIRAD